MPSPKPRVDSPRFTGGTIAGQAASAAPTPPVIRAPAPWASAALIAAVPGWLSQRRIEAESVAAIDSKDMDVERPWH